MPLQKLQSSVVNRKNSGESLQHVPGSQLPHINVEEVCVIQDEETASDDWHFKRRRGSPERSQRLECKWRIEWCDAESSLSPSLLWHWCIPALSFPLSLPLSAAAGALKLLPPLALACEQMSKHEQREASPSLVNPYTPSPRSYPPLNLSQILSKKSIAFRFLDSLNNTLSNVKLILLALSFLFLLFPSQFQYNMPPTHSLFLPPMRTHAKKQQKVRMYPFPKSKK